MKTRNIMTFRAENGIRLSELADRLKVSERELAYAEKFNTVDRELADKIISEYSLPDDYFTAETESGDSRSFGYFFKRSLVWYLLTGISFAVLTVPAVVTGLLGMKVNFSWITSLLNAVIITISCILMNKHIEKNNVCSKDFGKYKYLLWIIPANAALVLNLPLTAIDKVISGSLGNVAGNLITPLFTLIPAVFHILLAAFMMKLVFENTNGKAERILDILFIASAVSAVLYYVIYPAAFSSGRIMQWVRAGLLAAVTVLTALGLLVGTKKKPESNDIWYTTMPVITILAPSVISLVMNFI